VSGRTRAWLKTKNAVAFWLASNEVAIAFRLASNEVARALRPGIRRSACGLGESGCGTLIGEKRM